MPNWLLITLAKGDAYCAQARRNQRISDTQWSEFGQIDKFALRSDH
ncbi:hypothetical protein MSSD14B_42590 [Marinobacter salsuginis]|uniref:Uncharacterized protein n=1 Tax=Marinobacter salsuginis TaxID=418719 RepID=A0A5M3Q663_9GAMM|nr:hypothetical protein MSSD14B_42590 [Marinobacter salsuginis]